MNFRLVNKLIGTVAIILNLVFFIPWTWEIINTGGGSGGWGLLFLPVTFSCHLFIITGAFSLIKNDLQNNKRMKSAIIILLFILGLVGIVSGYWFTMDSAKLLTIAFFTLIYLTIHKKLRVEQTLFVTNVIGSIIMITIKTLVEL